MKHLAIHVRAKAMDKKRLLLAVLEGCTLEKERTPGCSLCEDKLIGKYHGKLKTLMIFDLKVNKAKSLQ